MKLPTCLTEEQDPEKEIIREDVLWFAIARFSAGRCVQVFMTWDWDSYCKEFDLVQNLEGEFKIWCGAHKDIEKFRKNCYAISPHDE